MTWKCFQCGKETFPGLYFCSDKHAKQLYVKLMHERAIIMAELRCCAVCGEKERVSTSMDTSSGYVSFERFRIRPVRNIGVYKEEGIEMHHVSRIPEKVIPLCIKCHRGVELGHLRPDLKPEMSGRAFNAFIRRQKQKKREEKAEVERTIRNNMWKNRMYGRF